jgi:hypothetical protein
VQWLGLRDYFSPLDWGVWLSSHTLTYCEPLLDVGSFIALGVFRFPPALHDLLFVSLGAASVQALGWPLNVLESVGSKPTTEFCTVWERTEGPIHNALSYSLQISVSCSLPCGKKRLQKFHDSAGLDSRPSVPTFSKYTLRWSFQGQVSLLSGPAQQFTSLWGRGESCGYRMRVWVQGSDPLGLGALFPPEPQVMDSFLAIEEGASDYHSTLWYHWSFLLLELLCKIMWDPLPLLNQLSWLSPTWTLWQGVPRLPEPWMFLIFRSPQCLSR